MIVTCNISKMRKKHLGVFNLEKQGEGCEEDVTVSFCY